MPVYLFLGSIYNAVILKDPYAVIEGCERVQS